jgi:hypothetical protein
MIFQDVQDVPDIWNNVQQNPYTHLRVLDRVTCLASDGTWCIKDALVVDADVSKVVLAIRPGDRIALVGKFAEGGANAGEAS